jgi:hypothetical protein
MGTFSGKEIAEKVLSCLKADTVLSGYVKKFAAGGIDAARNIFPFVSVSAVENEADALTIGAAGRMRNNCAIRIYGGTFHTLPETAHAGDESSGVKGILQLNADILNAVVANDFDGVFETPVKLLSSSTAHKAGSGGRSWACEIALSGLCVSDKISA